MKRATEKVERLRQIARDGNRTEGERKAASHLAGKIDRVRLAYSTEIRKPYIDKYI